jgi:hypothetical protein
MPLDGTPICRTGLMTQWREVYITYENLPRASVSVGQSDTGKCPRLNEPVLDDHAKHLEPVQRMAAWTKHKMVVGYRLTTGGALQNGGFFPQLF